MIVGLIIIQILLTAKQYFYVPVSRHENQNKKRIAHGICKFCITQKFSVEDAKERSQIRVMEVKKVTYGETL